MKSQGEIEAAVCDGISRFQQEYIGRGPRDIHAHLVGSLMVVRLQGVLTAAERQLLMPRRGTAPGDDGAGTPGAPCGPAGNGGPTGQGHSAGNSTGNSAGHSAGNGHDNGNGRSLLKQVRTHMVATGRPLLESIVEDAAGVKLVSVHHDISTVTGEEVLVFSLAEPPTCRPKKKS